MRTQIRVDKKDLILTSSKEVILQKGYQKTSVENITTYANIAKGSFYTYFKSKDLLLMEIIKEIVDSVQEVNKEFFTTPKTDLETRILKALEKSLCLEDKRIMNNLFLINLTSNLEALGEEIRGNLMLAKKITTEFWIDIFKEQNEELKFTENEMRNYALLIDGIVYSSVKKVIFYSHDAGIFITDIATAKERMESEEIKDEIKFIHKIIMNILKGER